jgi:hypothetical protein
LIDLNYFFNPRLGFPLNASPPTTTSMPCG